jgi:CubicO group peptidase (beta-lactamase class C family)
VSGIEATTDPAAVGLCADRLGRLDAHYRRYVDDGRLPGWLVAVARHGEVAHVATYGHRDREADLPVTNDTLWRIASMTKPITAVAALMLWEQGAFELRDPVSAFIPSFADTRVWSGGTANKFTTEPQRRPMELWQLFSHTAGLTYGFTYGHPVDELYRKAGFEWAAPADTSLETLTDRLAGLPLLFQPGAEWAYSMSIDVLGRVVEVVSGMRLDEFARTNITAPLGMHDAGWYVSEADAGRLAAAYVANPADGTALRFDAIGAGALHPPAAHMGGQGMVASAADYHRFAEMLRRGGELDGVRLLAPSTVRMMASNHLPGGVDLTAYGRPLFSETTFDGVGFGLGVSVTIDPVKAKVPGSIGEFGWGGAFSTFHWIDPVQDLTVLFMTQLLPSSTHPIRSQLKQLVHQAIVA